MEKNPSSQYNIKNIFNYDNVQDLSYFSSCFSESLRIEAPVGMSSSIAFT